MLLYYYRSYRHSPGHIGPTRVLVKNMKVTKFIVARACEINLLPENENKKMNYMFLCLFLALTDCFVL